MKQTKFVVKIVNHKPEEILMYLYNNAVPHGTGWIHSAPWDMTLDEAKILLKQTLCQTNIDHRYLFVNFETFPILNLGRYCEINGEKSVENIQQTICKLG